MIGIILLVYILGFFGMALCQVWEHKKEYKTADEFFSNSDWMVVSFLWFLFTPMLILTSLCRLMFKAIWALSYNDEEDEDIVLHFDHGQSKPVEKVEKKDDGLKFFVKRGGGVWLS